MKNKFKNLIKKELGKRTYLMYYEFIKKNLEYKIIDRQTVFYHMYNKLKTYDMTIVKLKQRELNNVLIKALNISRNYIYIIIFYFTSIILLILMGNNLYAIIAGVLIISISFIYKTYEYFLNKYCYIDAQILIIYKAVLDKIAYSLKE